MKDDFNARLWQMASNSPDLQEALKKNFRKEGEGYSIPVRTYCEATGEVEDIHYSIADIEDDTQRERFMDAIKSIDSMTVGEVSKMLGYASVAVRVKQAEGEELTPIEETLRDFDLTLFAMYVVRTATKVIGRTKPIE